MKLLFRAPLCDDERERRCNPQWGLGGVDEALQVGRGMSIEYGLAYLARELETTEELGAMNGQRE